MSIVVGYIGTKIYIGADSRGSDENGNYSDEYHKLFKSGNIFYGVVGSFRYRDILQELKLPIDIRSIRDVRKIRDEFRIACKMQDYDNKEIGSSTLIACRLGLFQISSDWHIQRFGTIVALGVGADIALGALYACSRAREALSDREEG